MFSFWKDLIFGVPQGSVPDDTTTYISDESLENVHKSLEKNSMLALR